MQLNRHSRLVRWYLFVNFCRSEEAEQKALAEATNLCAFVKWLAIGTITWVLIGVMLSIVVPCTWAVSMFVIMGGVTIGFIPVGWHASVKHDRVQHVLCPAAVFQWERKLGVRIGTRVIFPNHVWGTALVVLGAWALARWEVAGWSRVEIPLGWTIAHGTALAAVLLTVAYILRARWRNTAGWRVACAWLRAKKDRVCPLIEFVE